MARRPAERVWSFSFICLQEQVLHSLKSFLEATKLALETKNPFSSIFHEHTIGKLSMTGFNPSSIALKLVVLLSISWNVFMPCARNTTFKESFAAKSAKASLPILTDTCKLATDGINLIHCFRHMIMWTRSVQVRPGAGFSFSLPRAKVKKDTWSLQSAEFDPALCCFTAGFQKNTWRQLSILGTKLSI